MSRDTGRIPEKKNVELLAPAGDANAFLAAIAAGANAIYFGLDKFNARKRAENITPEQLKTLIPAAKSRGIQTYLTLNILFTQNEFAGAEELVHNAVAAGIDAVIVQDPGMMHRLKSAFPALAVHASTQCTTHNTAQCRLLAKLGVSQVNLSRELSIAEMEPLMQTLSAQHIISEVFVHGAFCISFSGQCYFSNALYGEAGNRGACVQPCRRTWQACGGAAAGKSAGKPCLRSAGTPFNLKDNNLFAEVAALIAAGAGSLKIEGRIKSAEYVWSVVSAWRGQLDRIAQGKTPLADSEKLADAVNRSYTDGYARGVIGADMFTAGSKDKSLILCGTVASYHADPRILTVKRQQPRNEDGDAELRVSPFPQPGDTLTLQDQQGRFVCTGEILARADDAGTHGTASFVFHITHKPAQKIAAGQQLFKIPAPMPKDQFKALLDAVRAPETGVPEKTGSLPEPHTPDAGTVIDITVAGTEGAPLSLCVTERIPPAHLAPDTATIPAAHQIPDDSGNHSAGSAPDAAPMPGSAKNTGAGTPAQATVFSDCPLERAQNRGLTDDILKDKIGRLGGSGFSAGTFNTDGLEPGLFVPPAVLNTLRRKAVAALQEVIANRQLIAAGTPEISLQKQTPPDGFVRCTGKSPETAEERPQAAAKAAACPQEKPRIFFICSRIADAAALLDHGMTPILEMPAVYRTDDPDLQQKEAYIAAHQQVIPYFPAILLEPDLQTAAAYITTLETDRLIYCENSGLALAAAEAGYRTVLGSHLNIANGHSAHTLARLLNASAFVPSAEIAPEEAANMPHPEDCGIWYPLYTHELLMQSRQCLVKNLAGCKKQCTDRSCIFACTKTVNFEPDAARSAYAKTGTQKIRLTAVKRPGFYSALYREHPVSNSRHTGTLRGAVSVWTADLRTITADSGTCTGNTSDTVQLALRCADIFAESGVQSGISGRRQPEAFPHCEYKTFFIRSNT